MARTWQTCQTEVISGTLVRLTTKAAPVTIPSRGTSIELLLWRSKKPNWMQCGAGSSNPSVKEDVQDAAAKVVPEACQATCGFWALVCLAGSLAAQALELDRRIPEVAVVRLGGSFRQPGAHAAEAAFWKALRQVVVVAKEGVITLSRRWDAVALPPQTLLNVACLHEKAIQAAHISDTGHLELSAVHFDAGQDVVGGKEATVADHQGLREHERLPGKMG